MTVDEAQQTLDSLKSGILILRAQLAQLERLANAMTPEKVMELVKDQ